MGEKSFTAAEGQYSSSEDTDNQSTSPRRRSDTGELTDHLEAAEMLKIAKLTEGTFDEHVLQNLFTRLSSSFATYTPDKSVMDYLHQHSSSLQWEKKLDFRTPREKQSQDTRPNKHEKRKERPK